MGNKIKFDIDSDWFNVSIKRDTVNAPVNAPVNRLNKLLDLVKSDNKITISKIAKKLDVNEKTIKRDISKLKESGKLKRIGSDKGGHWEVVWEGI